MEDHMSGAGLFRPSRINRLSLGYLPDLAVEFFPPLLDETYIDDSSWALGFGVSSSQFPCLLIRRRGHLW